MSLQEPGPGETLATVGTFAALVMSPHVHREGRHGYIHFVAVGTTSGLLVAQRPMCLTMSGKVTGGTVALPTVRAAVRFALK
jgi:hypothetical protein